MAIATPTWQSSSSTWTPEDPREQRLVVPNQSYPGESDRPVSPSRFRGRLQSLRRATSPSRPKTPTSPIDHKGSLGLNLLHEPSEPRVDFIFVHGLNGGSRKTWCSSSDPSTFWPKEWLPGEPGFRHVRIHSYGYDSDWTKKQESSLTIHDYGQALLADLYNSPSLKRNGNTPIVLVAHSMGGLVIKKAYLLARRDPIYKDIADRIHSLYFLATPHRGADSSNFLNSFISMSLGSGPKAFVKELIPGNGTLQAINDEFRHVCNDVGLWSFFEGLPTQAGPTSVMVVDKDSAVMGLPGEHTQYLQADHRHVVKFQSPEDPNYCILLRCFNTTLEEIEKKHISHESENHREQMRDIAAAFDIAERPESNFIRVADKLHPGSCEWLTAHPSFQAWLQCDVLDSQSTVKAITNTEATTPTPRFLWLNGAPGSGKSVVSTHVIQYLTANNLDCAYFFFKNNEKHTLTQLLLSLAIQMAESNFQIRHAFLTMLEEGETIDSHSDHIMVWNNIFLGRIFKMAFSQPQYWVIDALDECSTRSLPTLISMLSRIDPSVPLRIFMTSRPNGLVERLLNQEKILRAELHTGHADSLKDIEAFVRSKLSPSIIDDFNAEHDDSDLVAEVIEKSNGIFLWASLIMTRLDEAHSIEAMRKTLSEVPTEMSGMYAGILENIQSSPDNDLARCILKWVVCARSPLTTEELKEVVRMDINQTLRTPDRFAQVCGNLITVDNNFVQVMHQTVREFLTGEDSDYYIPRSWSHCRIAELCLTHLNGRNFSPPRTRRAPSSKSTNVSDSIFDEYAMNNFSYHLAQCSPSESSLHLLPLLAAFVSSNVLTWIEKIASTGRLSLITRTIQNLKVYLNRQVVTSSPLDPDYVLTLRFVDDLVRLSAIYGPNLLSMPSCIYSLIPLLCPASSIINWKFGRQFKQKVLCSFNNEWDERLTSFTFSARVLSIANAEQWFALGLGDGTIRLYRQSTFELLNVLHHGEQVRRLASGNLSGIMISGGIKTIKVWGPRQTLLWTATVPEQPLSFTFNTDDSKIYVALRSGEVYVFRAKNGARLDSLPILEDNSSDSDSDYGEHRQKRTIPQLIRICPTLGIAAIAYRSSHLQISYYEDDERVESFVKEGYEDGLLPPGVIDLAFNPIVDHNLMAVAYQDGDIVTLDPWTLQQQHSYHVNAITLAASPDGQTLAAGDSECVISLFAFDSLRLLCRIESIEERIMGIVFASSSLRFYDLRGNACNVWEPAVLIKKDLTDDNSSEMATDDFYLPTSSLACTRTFEDNRGITVMTQAGDSNFVFCGREDGSITVHDVSAGKAVAEFKFHARMVDIKHLEWNAKARVLFSVDASRRCIATRLSPPPAGPWRQDGGHLVDFRARDVVLQALVSPDGTSFLVSTQTGEELHRALGGKEPAEEAVVSRNSSATGWWLAHPTDSDRLILVDNGALHLFLWASLARETPEQGIAIALPDELLTSNVPLAREWHSRPGLATLVQTVDISCSPSSSLLPPTITISSPRIGSSATGTVATVPTTAFLVLDISKLSSTTTTTIHPTITVRRLISPVRTIIGIYRSNLYFMSGRGWVCSISLKNLSASKSYNRHFFIPSVWQTGSEPIARVVSKTTAVFAYRDEVVVLQGFLDFENKTVFEECGAGVDGEEEKGKKLIGKKGQGQGQMVPIIRTGKVY